MAKTYFSDKTYIKKLISYLPQNNTQSPPRIKTDDDPNRLDHNLINIRSACDINNIIISK